MWGIAEICIAAARRLLPQPLHGRWAAFFNDLAVRSAHSAPRSNTEVYAWSPAMQGRFPGAKTVTPDPASYPRYSLISTCRDEADSIDAFLDSIARQSLPPAEVVLCDGGSSDGTPERVRRWFESYSADAGEALFSLVLLEVDGANIAEGRNRAVAAASHDVIALSDAGSTLDKSWAERLLAPFADDPEMEAAMGWYKPVVRERWQSAFVYFLLPRLEAIDPQTFLPSGRSLALKRAAFASAGGYPAYLSRAGEDTLFDFHLKTAVKRFSFVPEAIAFWRAPQSPAAMLRTIFSYAKGDGESGRLFGPYYLSLLPRTGKLLFEFALVVLLGEIWLLWPTTLTAVLWFAAAGSLLVRTTAFVLSYSPFSDCRGKPYVCVLRAAAVLGMAFAQTFGFLAGWRSRADCRRRRLAAADRGDVVLLAPHAVVKTAPDAAMAAARKYLDRNWFVTVVFFRFPEYDDEFSYPYAHPRLEQHIRSGFTVEAWLERNRRGAAPDNRPLLIRDECRDAISAELRDQFLQLAPGAQAAED